MASGNSSEKERLAICKSVTHMRHQGHANERAGFVYTAFNLANDIFGAGIVGALSSDISGALNDIAVPYFIAQFGFWLSPLGFVLVGLVTGRSKRSVPSS